MAETVVGLFEDQDAAKSAVQSLIKLGFERDKVSLIASDHATGTSLENGDMAVAAAGTGALSGAVVGGVAGVLIGLGFTVLPIAGLLLAGPIAGLVAGAAAGAATGGVVGGLIGMDIPKEYAETYAEGIRRGGALVTVQTSNPSRSAIAHKTLDIDGAVDVDERGAAYRAEGFKGFDPSAKPYEQPEIEAERARRRTSAAPMRAASDGALEAVGEELSVDKGEPRRGVTRVRSFVTEKPVSE